MRAIETHQQDRVVSQHVRGILAHRVLQLGVAGTAGTAGSAGTVGTADTAQCDSNWELSLLNVK